MARKRLTRVPAPGKDLEDWAKRVYRAITELQAEVEAGSSTDPDAIHDGDDAGGDLDGTYPDPSVVAVTESGGQQLTLATVAANELLQRVGTTIDGIARAGVDSTAVHSGDSAGGSLGGTYPTSLTVTKINETSGPTALTIGTITDGEFLKRVGSTLVSAAGGSTDTNAIHTNTSAEISGLTEKTTPVDADLYVIEDSAASNAKKKVKAKNNLAGYLSNSSAPVDIISSGAPSTGYVLTATSATAATWQARSIGAWCVIRPASDQTTIDESTPDLVTNWDTIVDGSTSHGVTVSGGIITLPANTSGFKWELVAQVWLTHSTAVCQAAFQWYSDPSSGNTAIGIPGYQNSVAHTSAVSWAGAGDALCWFSGAGTVGLRCIATTGAATVTVRADTYSRVLVREVKA